MTQLKFQTFLKGNMYNTPDVDTVQNVLQCTLGQKLSKLNWNKGTAGTGIIVILDLSDNETDERIDEHQVFKESVDIIDAWLIEHNGTHLSRGNIVDSFITTACGYILSIVNTGNCLKVIIH